MSPRLKAIPFVLVLLACAACDPLPSAMRDRGQRVQGQIERIAGVVETEHDAYTALSDSEAFAFFEPYATREEWAAAFEAAERELERARDLNRRVVVPLLDANDREQTDSLNRTLVAIDRALAEVRRAARRPMERRTTLGRARERAPEIVGQAGERARAVALLEESLTSTADELKARYEHRSADIDSLAAPIIALGDSAERALATARTQLRAHQAGRTTDYAALADATEAIEMIADTLRFAAPTLRTKLLELDRSYSKVLVDMRVEHSIVVGRSTWNDCCYGEDRHTYAPRRVSTEAFRYFDEQGPRLDDWRIATLRYGYSGNRGLNLAIPREYWEELDVNVHERYNSKHDEASFWIENWGELLYQKHLVVENGDTATTDWIQVEGDRFWAHRDALGMEIVAKPYGLFEEEALSTPAPAGMSYVGNSRYGEWRRGAERDSVWHWHGPYVFYAGLRAGGPYRYGRNEWGLWTRDYRGRRPYYGRNANNPTYGTRSARTSSGGRFARTTFARRGGFRSQGGSVRGAGPAVRGRGPGGAGK